MLIRQFLTMIVAATGYRTVESKVDIKWNEHFILKKTTPTGFQGRIINGTTVSREKYPFQAQVHSKTFCGGVILSDTHVITAAHCLSDRAEDTEVRVGSLIKSVSGWTYTADNIYQHPGFYDHGTWAEYDVSLIKLKSSLKFSKDVRMIGLPLQRQTFTEGTMCSVMGWGLESRTAQPYSHSMLKETSAKIASRELCGNAYSVPIKKTMICAWSGFADELRGPCWVSRSMILDLKLKFLFSG